MRVARPAGFPGKSGRPEAFCVARLGVVPVGMQVWNRTSGPGLGGAGERARRSMRKFGVPSSFSVQSGMGISERKLTKNPVRCPHD